MIRFAFLLAMLLVPSALASAGESLHPWTAVCRVTVLKPRVVGGHTVVGGSGTLIAVNGDQALVLTVKHVALGVGLSAACDWDGQIMHGEVLAVHPSADVALLLVETPSGIRPVAIAAASPDSGPFRLAGYPGYDRETLRYQSGAYVDLDSETLTVTCRPEKGMSGGPAFDRYGRVVGTVSAFGRSRGFCGSGAAMLDLCDDYIK